MSNIYPDIAISWDSESEFNSGRIVEVTRGGTIRGRNTFGGAGVYTLNVIHPFMDSAEAATLKAFYEANENLIFRFNWPLDYSGSTHQYLMYFSEFNDPRKISPEYYEATVTLMGYRT